MIGASPVFLSFCPCVLIDGDGDEGMDENGTKVIDESKSGSLT